MLQHLTTSCRSNLSSVKAVITREGKVKEISVIFPQHPHPHSCPLRYWWRILNTLSPFTGGLLLMGWGPRGGWQRKLYDRQHWAASGWRGKVAGQAGPGQRSAEWCSYSSPGILKKKGPCRGQGPPAEKERKSSRCPSLTSVYRDLKVLNPFQHSAQSLKKEWRKQHSLF